MTKTFSATKSSVHPRHLVDEPFDIQDRRALIFRQQPFPQILDELRGCPNSCRQAKKLFQWMFDGNRVQVQHATATRTPRRRKAATQLLQSTWLLDRANVRFWAPS